jgi:hypothetical protein
VHRLLRSCGSNGNQVICPSATKPNSVQLAPALALPKNVCIGLHVKKCCGISKNLRPKDHTEILTCLIDVSRSHSAQSANAIAAQAVAAAEIH